MWPDGNPRVTIELHDTYRYEFVIIRREALRDIQASLATKNNMTLKEFRELGGHGTSDWYPTRKVARGVRTNTRHTSKWLHRSSVIANLTWFFDISGSIRIKSIREN